MKRRSTDPKKHESKTHNTNANTTEPKVTTMNNKTHTNIDSTTNHIQSSSAPHGNDTTVERSESEDHLFDLVLAPNPQEQAAFAQMLPIAQALDPKDIMQVNLDPGAIVFVAVAVAERMMAYRDTLAHLPAFDASALETLQPASLALSLAHSDYLVATAPKDSLPDLAERAGKIQSEFEAWLPGLTFAGLIDGTRFDGLRTPVGFRDRVYALNAYTRAFRGADWNAIKAKSTLTDELLREAELICQRMTAIVGRREINPQKIAAMTDMRARMFTLVVSRYDELRRAAVFLRWHQGDADTVVPSLYVKGPRSKQQNAADGQNGNAGDGSNATPASQSAQPVHAPVGAPITPVPVTLAATPAAHADATHNANNAEVGMPESPPFRTA